MSDFNAFDSTSNAFRDSGFNARGRNRLTFGAGVSGGAANFPAGDSLQFYAFAPTFPLPSFRWNGAMFGEADEGWGRKSFTIRYWWKAGHQSPAPAQIGSSIQGPFRTGYFATFFVQPNIDVLSTGVFDVPSGLWLNTHVPTIRFGVWTGAAFEIVRHHFTQSPETSGTGVNPGPGPYGGTIGPLIEMTEDAWHRTIVWYDRAALEIGIQLDDYTPDTLTISAPIPAGATQGLLVGENEVWNNFDYGFDEYGLWNDYVWTSGERAADWNAGAGAGWPGVLSAVSRQPMAYWRFENPEDITPEGIASMV